MTETVFWDRHSSEACGRSRNGHFSGPKLSKTGPKLYKTGPKLSKTGPKVYKTGPKLSKTGLKYSKTQSNGRANLKYSRNTPRDPETWVCSLPLGSPTGVPKRSYVRVRVVPP